MFRNVLQRKYLVRYREIISFLFKYGVGFLFDNFIFMRFRRSRTDEQNYSIGANGRPQKLRQALEELGPTFIKLGQLLSVRPDILPPAYIYELEKLQDEVPAFSAEEALAVCAKNGIKTEKAFSYFSPEPIAAASIAQVHKATLANGEEVAVKIQRPGVSTIIKTDLDILSDLGHMMEKRFEWARLSQVSSIIAELRRAITLELDFLAEAKNIERFRQNFKNHPNIIIPDVIWEYTNSEVLVMEFVDGIKISDLDTLKAKKINSREIAEKLIDAFYCQIYEFGFFHADPHPGNLAITDDGKLIFYDFGQVGTIDDLLKEQCLTLLVSMVNYDVNGVTRTLLEIGIETKPINRLELAKDVARLQKKYYGMPLSEIKVGEAVMEIIDLFNLYQVKIPAELSLLAKLTATAEGIVSQLDPTISIVDIAEPYGKKALFKRYSPTRIRSSVSSALFTYMNLAKNLPFMVEDLVHLLEAGEIKIKREEVYLPQAVNKINLMVTRLSLALVISALIIGLAVLGENSLSITIGSFSLFKIITVAVIVLTLCFLYTIFKSPKKEP